MEIETFLTAYDPSDLPGSSIDPLGFERGYLVFADKILPGLTNAARRPRYFGMLCAGAYLSGDLFRESPRTQYNERLERLTRFERFWALANVLAPGEGGSEEELSGLRGVTYARAKADDVVKNGEKQVNADFKLLARQVQYGAVGIYGAVADRMRFLDRQVLALSPDLGDKLARGFIKETAVPRPVLKAVEEDGSVNVGTLSSWGERCHVNGSIGKTEADCLRDALHLDPVRSRMAELLAKFPAQNNETELARLFRIHKALKSDKTKADLKEAICAILFYERSYGLILLAFERLLWHCRQDQAGSVSYGPLKEDPVMERVQKNLPRTVDGFLSALEKGESENFRKDLHRSDDVKMFLQEVRTLCGKGETFIGSIMARHADVQRGKFDKGRRKMPWLEYVSGGRIALTSTRVGGLRTEATKPSQIIPHPYRLDSADALIEASRS